MRRLNNICIYVSQSTVVRSVSDVLPPLGGACQSRMVFLSGPVTLPSEGAEHNRSVPVAEALLPLFNNLKKPWQPLHLLTSHNWLMTSFRGLSYFGQEV